MEKKEYIVYAILLDGIHKYVGCTDNFKRRKRQHTRYIGDKKNSAIPEDIDPVLIDFVILETADNEQDALKAEDKYIQEYDTIHNGWNRARSGLISLEFNEYQKQWRKDNQDKHKAQQKRYFAKHYDDNKEALMAKHKKWYEENKERVKAYDKERSKRYYQEHKEEIKEKSRLYKLRKKQNLIENA